MILSDERILEEMDKGTIKVKPYEREFLCSNSYDVHLRTFSEVRGLATVLRTSILKVFAEDKVAANAEDTPAIV